MKRQLFAELTAQEDPRMKGQGEVFDRYPHASMPGFFERFMKGDKLKTGWVEDTDYERPGFDPERPLAPHQ